MSAAVKGETKGERVRGSGCAREEKRGSVCGECVRGHGYEWEWESGWQEGRRRAERGGAWCKRREGRARVPAGAGAFVRQSTRAQAQGERVHVTQICVNTLSLTFSPLSCRLRLVQRQPPIDVVPERHLSPDGADKLRDEGCTVSLLLQTWQQRLLQH